MHPPTKDQTMIGYEDQTLDASDSIDNKDMADQSKKDEADINYMLHRFGVAPLRGQPTYGEYDDTFDLQTAIEATRDARAAFYKLPKELTDKFKSMEEMLNAIENGSLVLTDKELNEEPPKPQPPPNA